MRFLQEVPNHTQILTQKEMGLIILSRIFRKTGCGLEKIDRLTDPDATNCPITGRSCKEGRRFNQVSNSSQTGRWSEPCALSLTQQDLTWFRNIELTKQ